MQFIPTLFNLYLDNIIKLYEANVAKGIVLHRHKMVNMSLFIDDQMAIVFSEDGLQRAVHQLSLNKENIHVKFTHARPR